MLIGTCIRNVHKEERKDNTILYYIKHVQGYWLVFFSLILVKL